MTTVTASRSDDAPEVRPRTPLLLAVRPLGYLLIGLVWTTISLVILGMGPGILAVVAYGSFTGNLGDVEIAMFAPHNGVETAELLGAIPLLALIWGRVCCGCCPARRCRSRCCPSPSSAVR